MYYHHQDKKQILGSFLRLNDYSNEGICSWYDFAKAIFKIADKKIKLNPIESSKYSTAAKRPYYSVLNKNKIKNEFKIQIPHWEESLRNLIKC